MEILKDKKYIIGGLAIVGAIALFAYLKPKATINSDGFYGADGKMSFPNNTCNLPDTFVKTVTTKANGIKKSYCARYDRRLEMTPNGVMAFQYRRQLNIPNATFVNGNFINSNGTSIITMAQIINSSEYESAFIYGQRC
jgi:hypothetical protein